MKRIYTSYFAKSGKHPQAIAISGDPPNWAKEMAHLPELAPSWNIVSRYKRGHISSSMFKVLYLEELRRRGKTPKEVLELIPDGAILVCYEKTGTFCHRHIAAEWLRQAGDVEITELP